MAQDRGDDPDMTGPGARETSQMTAAKTMLAMELAIEHFNRGHRNDIFPESQQFRYMMSLIDQMPDLLDYALSLSSTDSFIEPYQAVVLYNLYEGDARLQEFEELVAGCGKRLESGMETFNLRDPQCANDLVGRLRDLGFATAGIEPESEPYRLVWLKLGEGNYRDLDFLLKRARSIGPDVKALLGEAYPYHQYDKMIGASEGAYILRSSGTNSVSDPVTIRFWSGWGDCPSGCIDKDYADYTATPTHSVEEGFRFAISDPVLSSNRPENEDGKL